AAELERELGELGVRVTIAACDIADRAAVSALLAQLDQAGDSVRTVVHAAGVLRDAALADATMTELATVASAKIAGDEHLHELFADRSLDAFVLFSSLSGVVGNSHQASYAAANAYLDALAQHRRDADQTATAIAWGLWAGGGMGDSPAVQAALRQRGLPGMAPDLAIASLHDALADDETALLVADIDWHKFAPYVAANRPRPLLDELDEARAAIAQRDDGDRDGASAGPARDERGLIGELAAMTAGEREKRMLALVVAEIATILGHSDPSRIDPDTGFVDLGLDSLMAVGLRQRLRKITNTPIPVTLAFDRPSPRRVAEFVLELLGPALEEAQSAAPSSADRSSAGEERGLVGELAAMTAAEREKRVLALVLAEIAAILGHSDPARID
ncbi:MAG: beta-ketoacyl reductase, partial [Myxococcota bacterium]